MSKCDAVDDVYGQTVDGLDCLARTGFDVWHVVVLGLLLIAAGLLLTVVAGKDS